MLSVGLVFFPCSPNYKVKAHRRVKFSIRFLSFLTELFLGQNSGMFFLFFSISPIVGNYADMIWMLHCLYCLLVGF